MRLSVSVFLCAFAFIVPAFASEPMEPVMKGASATKARDINGFELGSPIRSATLRAKVKFAQGELVQTTLDGIEYDFGVCPSGRIYRIQSSQALGNFIPGQKFISNLQNDLFRKYGRTIESDSGNWAWDLIEPVRHSEGDIIPFKTNWLSVILSGGTGSPINLEMTMIDFRICWEDKVRMNDHSRDKALEAITF